MERKQTDTRPGSGWGKAAATLIGGAAGCLAMVLLVLAPGDDEPLTWAFWATKAGGLALLLATSWIYERFIKDGGEDDDDLD